MNDAVEVTDSVIEEDVTVRDTVLVVVFALQLLLIRRLKLKIIEIHTVIHTIVPYTPLKPTETS